MSQGRKRFKILTRKDTDGTWASSLNAPRLYKCPAYTVVVWCPKRKKFRFKDTLAVGVPYFWSESRMYRLGPKRTLIPAMDAVDHFGQQLAAQNGLPWVKTFDPSWKLQDLMLMRLQGKI